MSVKPGRLLFGLLIAVLPAVAVGRLADQVFAPVIPAKPGYTVVVSAADSAGGAAASAALTPAQFNALVAAASVADGEKAIKKCAACHNFTAGGANGVGPALHSIFGRDIASASGYNYSDALKSKAVGAKWDEETLNQWLANPQAFAKGTKMMLAVGKDAERAAIVAYLKSLK